MGSSDFCATLASIVYGKDLLQQVGSDFFKLYSYKTVIYGWALKELLVGVMLMPLLTTGTH